MYTYDDRDELIKEIACLKRGEVYVPPRQILLSPEDMLTSKEVSAICLEYLSKALK